MPRQARQGRSNPPISFRPSDETRQQLDALMAAWGENQTQAVVRCIERAYREAATSAGKTLPATELIERLGGAPTTPRGTC